MVKEHEWPDSPILTLRKQWHLEGSWDEITGEYGPAAVWHDTSEVTFTDTEPSNILNFKVEFKALQPWPPHIARFLVEVYRHKTAVEPDEFPWKMVIRDLVAMEEPYDPETRTYSGEWFGFTRNYSLEQHLLAFPPLGMTLKFRLLGRVWVRDRPDPMPEYGELYGEWGRVHARDFTATFNAPKRKLVSDLYLEHEARKSEYLRRIGIKLKDIPRPT